jgi:hypothetical protein
VTAELDTTVLSTSPGAIRLFDLWTRMLSINGNPVRAAFVFKGPAAFRPMKIADLGKNGDQIDRSVGC